MWGSVHKHLSFVHKMGYRIPLSISGNALECAADATLLLEYGANIKDVQQRLGHSNITTTMDTYAHVTEKMARSTVAILEKAVNGNLSTT